MVSDHVNIDIWCFWLPGAVVVGVSGIMLCAILWKGCSVLLFSQQGVRNRGAGYLYSPGLSSTDLPSGSTGTGSGSGNGVSNSSEVPSDSPAISSITAATTGTTPSFTFTSGLFSMMTAMQCSCNRRFRVTPAPIPSAVPAVMESNGVEDEGVGALADLGDKIRILTAPLLFSVVFLVMAVGAMYGRFALFVTFNERLANMDAWVACIFESYFNEFSSHVQLRREGFVDMYNDVAARQAFAYATCGENPKSTVHVAIILWFFFSTFGHALIVSIIFSKPKYVQKLCFGRSC